nr:unnamed protein product [Digitaria exilis]
MADVGSGYEAAVTNDKGSSGRPTATDEGDGSGSHEGAEPSVGAEHVIVDSLTLPRGRNRGWVRTRGAMRPDPVQMSAPWPSPGSDARLKRNMAGSLNSAIGSSFSLLNSAIGSSSAQEQNLTKTRACLVALAVALAFLIFMEGTAAVTAGKPRSLLKQLNKPPVSSIEVPLADPSSVSWLK